MVKSPKSADQQKEKKNTNGPKRFFTIKEKTNLDNVKGLQSNTTTRNNQRENSCWHHDNAVMPLMGEFTCSNSLAQ